MPFIATWIALLTVLSPLVVIYSLVKGEWKPVRYLLATIISLGLLGLLAA